MRIHEPSEAQADELKRSIGKMPCWSNEDLTQDLVLEKNDSVSNSYKKKKEAVIVQPMDPPKNKRKQINIRYPVNAP